jgi:hypothetical protein
VRQLNVRQGRCGDPEDAAAALAAAEESERTAAPAAKLPGLREPRSASLMPTV